MTSRGFFEFLGPYKQPNKILIQPNKISNIFSQKKRPHPQPVSDNLVFSYVGAFRYPNTVFRFARVVGENYPNYSFHFYGDSHWTETVKSLANQYENVKYFGPYKNPEELEDIYSQIDIVVACYDTLTLNERVAEPNKLYESLYFIKPIIVSKNSFLEKQVIETYHCGFAIDATKNINIIEFIESLKKDNLAQIIENIYNISNEEIIDDNSENIFSRLKQLNLNTIH